MCYLVIACIVHAWYRGGLRWFEVLCMCMCILDKYNLDIEIEPSALSSF